MRRLFLLVLFLLVLVYFCKTSNNNSSVRSDGNWKVYGTKNCGWTVKQLKHLENNNIPYEFIDCDSEECSVTAFPTLIHSQSGEKKVGYTEKLSM